MSETAPSLADDKPVTPPPLKGPPMTVEGLADKAVRILREYQDRPGTGALRELAPVVVDLRSHFTLQDGRPDWGGRSPEYRRHMANVYARAQVPAEDLDRFQSALRYHVGSLLRDRATKDELIAVGMITTKPKERQRNTRDALMAMKEVSAPRQDVVRLAAYAQALVEYVDDAAIPALKPERAEDARKALEAIQARTAELLRRLG